MPIQKSPNANGWVRSPHTYVRLTHQLAMWMRTKQDRWQIRISVFSLDSFLLSRKARKPDARYPSELHVMPADPYAYSRTPFRSSWHTLTCHSIWAKSRSVPWNELPTLLADLETRPVRGIQPSVAGQIGNYLERPKTEPPCQTITIASLARWTAALSPSATTRPKCSTTSLKEYMSISLAG
jgi:hypothetical protein